MRNYIIILLLAIALLTPTLKRPARAESCGRFGVVAHLNMGALYGGEMLPRALDVIAEAGLSWVRVNWNWKYLQWRPGPFYFPHHDRLALEAERRGVQLLPILTAVPPWASSAPDELKAQFGGLPPVDRYRPNDLAAWLNYVSVVVERYDGDGLEDAPGSPRIGQWEVWNEPNLALFWPPAPDPQEYVALLAATHSAIIAADPTAQVVIGGLAGGGANGRDSYLQAVYDAGGADYFDVLSVHLYLHPAERDVRDLQTAIENVRRVMAANGDAHTPLWLTEIGWSDAPNAWGGPTITGAELARFLAAVYSAPLDAERIFWYNFRNMAAASDDVEHNFGLVHHDLTPKPAFDAYRRLASDCQTGAQ